MPKLHRQGTGLFIRSWERFCKMFSESFPCLLGQHGSCSTAQMPGELSKNILQNLFHDLMNNPVCKFTQHKHRVIKFNIIRHLYQTQENLGPMTGNNPGCALIQSRLKQVALPYSRSKSWNLPTM